MEIEAVVLGGQDKLEDWVKEEGVPHKALLDIAGKRMIDWIIDALKDTPQIKRIILIGKSEIFPEDIRKRVDVFLEDSGSFMKNIENVYKITKYEYSVFVPTDVPLITSQIYTKTFEFCENFEKGCYLYVLVNKKRDVEKKFPGTKRTYWKLKGGYYKIGNILPIRRELYPSAINFGYKLLKARKSPIKMASLFPISFMIKALFHLATLKDCEVVVCDITELRGRAVPIPFPEIAIDVDKKEDLIFVRKIMEKIKDEGTTP
ncbi:MAG TPA: hypothetical protein ENG53_01220 [Firmicutes bacterium]|nr:hypothetical protein [Bacillota bacterium]